MKNMVLLLFFCLCAVINICGQTKEITQNESIQQLITSFGKLSEISWRKTTKSTFYKNGTLTSTTEIIEESVKPDKRRYVIVAKIGKRLRKIETISIGENSYCRKNNSVWKKSDTECQMIGDVGASDEVINSKYTVEEAKLSNQNVKLFRQYIIYKSFSTTNKGKEEVTFWDYKFWVNDEELILRREIVAGLLKPKKVYSRMTETFEYNPKNLKIEAPIE